jgi:hypothetical protein
MRDRGRPLETPLAKIGTVTIHPAAVLRTRDRDERDDARAGLVNDLAGVRRALAGSS